MFLRNYAQEKIGILHTAHPFEYILNDFNLLGEL